jgi:flavodoxin
MSKNELVIYHSVQGNTEIAAKIISEELNCDLKKINEKDDSNAKLSLSSGRIIRQLANSSQFKLRINEIDISQYDRIYVGGPCWCYTYTPAIGQFLKEADYRNKEIVFFITHGGNFGKSFEKFKEAMKGGNFVGGMDFYNVNKIQEHELREQVKSQLYKINSI